jgi:hypothetical protein
MKNGPEPDTVVAFGPFNFDKALGKLSKTRHSRPAARNAAENSATPGERPGAVVSRREL